MSWTTNDATNDATSDAARGWEQTQVTSNKLANESPFLQANANSDMHRFNVQGEARFRDSSGGIYPEIQPVTVDKDGGRVTIDAFNRVIQMQDAAGRCFQFGYDPKSGELNRVYNEDGVWKRSEHHGKYTDEWKGEHKQKWHGEVTVNPDGYSFTQGNERVTFAPNGSRTKEYSSAGKVFYSDTITADGKHKVIDSRLGTPSAQDKPVDKVAPIEPKDPHAADSKDHGKEQPKPSVDANGVETRKSADGTTVIDRQHNTQLNYDREGRLTEFKDPAGRRVAFKDYDDTGKPHTIENQMGTWHKTGPDLWTNDRLNKTLHINVQVNKDGYTFSDLSGKKVTRNVDGSIVEEYRGLKTRTDINGKVTRQMIDGSPLTGNVLTGSIDFTVKKGDTKAGRLHISQGDFQVVHGRGGDV
ncbi:MAG: hypothetical protein JSS86_23245, partial [Cyanobacteria bacterium SZAS LIN-2]|nr:hypothetical protein [Cyanobacteria bacterium SZAS LIN-2]